MKYKLFWILLLLTILISACNGSDGNENLTNEVNSSNDNTAVQTSGNIERENINLEGNQFAINQLLYGTVFLEDSDIRITNEQARNLLPLWQLLDSMAASNTSAEEEIGAVIKQINANMTIEQLSFIDEQEFDRTMLLEVANSMGIKLAIPDNPLGGERGGFPGGGGGSGGGNPGGDVVGGTPSPEQQATLEAFRAERGGGSTNTLFYELVIQLLEMKIK